MSESGDIYKFINGEFKTVNKTFFAIQSEISQINERLAALEAKTEKNLIDVLIIEKLNTKLDDLNSKLTNDDSVEKTKVNWIQIGKVIGLIITGMAAILGGYFAGLQ